MYVCMKKILFQCLREIFLACETINQLDRTLGTKTATEIYASKHLLNENRIINQFLIIGFSFSRWTVVTEWLKTPRL